MDPAIYLLNADVLFIICDYLSLVDKACFALSCKRYFGLFVEATKEEAFEFPTFHKIQVIKALRWYVDPLDVPRNQLLIRFEDSRWAWCGDWMPETTPAARISGI
ncbi:hypothetical protein DPV78_010908 [Talaromyces pinophilus]|nr:hypothetical protein DPV78_010908 [Talaromyces pinophilus]